jgi:formylglycine-generating enzyme required for sulfatase activity
MFVCKISNHINAMEKRYNVFVSSTFEDLKNERIEVIKRIVKMKLFPMSMEFFCAANKPSWEVIERVIEECDYYVLIIGGRYGSKVKETGESYTQKEFRYAHKRRIPIIAFLHKEYKKLPVYEEKNSEKDKKGLKAFIKEVKKDRQIDSYTNAAELASNVQAGLLELIKKEPRQGWVRAKYIHPNRPDMVDVEGGEFRMGSIDGRKNESPVHFVTLSDFRIGKYPVTQKQWNAVMDNNPPSGNRKGDNYPVENVSLSDAQKFCNALSEKTGKRYRLPTEAEWEYAARGGKKRKNYKYSGSNSLNEVGWYCENSDRTTYEVGEKEANELGIYDMSGNVWEWCSDWYGDYSNERQEDPTGPSCGSDRIIRGGSWNSNANVCRSTHRGAINPEDRHPSLGFRVVEELPRVCPALHPT